MGKYNADYHREYYQRNKERWRESAKRETPEQKEHRLARCRAYNKRVQRKRQLAKYGLTEKLYDQTVAAQDGECAICCRREKLYVDHCHQTGWNRALLCNRCNMAIGLFGESVENLRAAIVYLSAFRAIQSGELTVPDTVDEVREMVRSGTLPRLRLVA